MQKKWNIKTPHPILQVALSNELIIHPILAQVLINRNIQTVEAARSFLTGTIASLHDPFLLKDMDRAVERIRLAAAQKECVLIYGDYDVDGVTSSVVLKHILDSLKIDCVNYIPHRMEEGYGLNHSIVEYALEKKVCLLISVDCGINAFSEVEALRNAGIDVIIFDHHEPSIDENGKDILPRANAVVDPKRRDCAYPFKGLASVGLMAKLAHAIKGCPCEDDLDLVALGTVADVAELRGENRIFVKYGLPKINKTKNHGLKALCDVARIWGKPMRPSSIGFVLGPRLNATGRMGTALDSLSLLLCQDPAQALLMAKNLDDHNALRQKTQKEIVEEAFAQVEREINFKDQQVIVLNGQGWHKGVLGIVASRILEKYYRPTIVISTVDGIGTGSARSIEGFHIFEALTHCAEHLENYGGHKRAAGLTVREEKIDFFRQSINDFARDHLDLDILLPSIDIDCEIALSAIDLDLTYRMGELEPHGEGNPEALFCTRRLIVKSPPMVMGKDTLKFWVTDEQTVLPAIGFGMGKYRDMIAPGRRVDLAYALTIDDWNKDPLVTLKLKDIKESI